MSDNINWNNAPDYTTHAWEDGSKWYRLIDNSWYYYGVSIEQWLPCTSALKEERLVAKPSSNTEYLMYGEHKVKVVHKTLTEVCIVFKKGDMKIVRHDELDPLKTDEEIHIDELTKAAIIECLVMGEDASIPDKNVVKSMINRGYRKVLTDDITQIRTLVIILKREHAKETHVVDHMERLEQLIGRLK